MNQFQLSAVAFSTNDDQRTLCAVSIGTSQSSKIFEFVPNFCMQNQNYCVQNSIFWSNILIKNRQMLLKSKILNLTILNFNEEMTIDWHFTM